MAFDSTKPANGTKPVSAEIRANFIALKSIADANAGSASSIAADLSGFDAEISDLTSQLSESYYTSSETDTLLGDKVDSSTIDTVGDLLSKNAGGLTAIAAGAAGTVLTGQGAGVLPAWESGLFYSKIDFGKFERAGATPWGTQEIACDFEPDFVIFIAGAPGAGYYSIGFDDGTSPICFENMDSGIDLNYSIHLGEFSHYSEHAKITAKDSDSFTLTWTITENGLSDTDGIWIAVGLT
jgi:hypothetical protein